MVVLLSSSSLALQAQVMPRVQFAGSPSAMATVSPFNPRQHPGFAGFFTAEFVSAQPAAFVLSNRSSKPIVGIAARWVITDQNGQKRTHVFQNHSFLTAHTPPVASPGSKLLLVPGVFVPEANMSSKRAGITMNPQLAAELDGASEVRLEIDCILLEDGEASGLNCLRLVSDIRAQKAAADGIVQQLNAAEANGQKASDVLPTLAAPPADGSDLAAMWTSRLASQMVTPNQFDVMLARLKKFPALPRFHRSGGAPI
jgi:hypothetical protein